MATGFEKHTDRELLQECWNCINDLLKELMIADPGIRPKASALLLEITRKNQE